MSQVTAKEIIRRLRSSGIKVFLKGEQVTFSTLDEVSTELKKSIRETGPAMKVILRGERSKRKVRAELKNDVPNEQL